MFMIDGVELRLLDQPHDVRKLQRDYTTRLQRGFKTRREIIDIGNMSVYVVADNQVRPLALSSETISEPRTKKLAKHANTQLLGCDCRTFGRFDTKARNTGSDKISEQIPVIGGDLHHEACLIQPQPRDYHLYVSGCMREPT